MNEVTSPPYALDASAAPSGTEADQVDVWDYLAERIDEFAVAKSIVDHFDVQPKGLDNKGVDTLGLYLRAKVTIKRQQIAYAQAQQAIDKARQDSRSFGGVLKSVVTVLGATRDAFAAKPEYLGAAALAVLWFWFR